MDVVETPLIEGRIGKSNRRRKSEERSHGAFLLESRKEADIEIQLGSICHVIVLYTDLVFNGQRRDLKLPREVVKSDRLRSLSRAGVLDKPVIGKL